MPVSVVVGGQYGSEGKGKVALELVRRDRSIKVVVRPGGTNSGHTGYTTDNRKLILRQLPAAAIDGNVTVVLPPGSYIEPALFLREVAELGLEPSQVLIDPRARVIRPEHIEWEKSNNLLGRIGSTGSGTGAAVLSRIARGAKGFPASVAATEVPAIASYINETAPFFDAVLMNGERILVEGTQGFGLSPIHGDAWPNCTSRDTTAAAFISEAALSPRCVDQIYMVIRSHPIRVGGNSGPLSRETTWENVAREAGGQIDPELTSVTRKTRRIANFDADVVKRAILANSPTAIILNHIDYLDRSVYGQQFLSDRCIEFVEHVQKQIGLPISEVGTGPNTFVSLHERRLVA
jgi:adenylosuccinate synthase